MWSPPSTAASATRCSSTRRAAVLPTSMVRNSSFIWGSATGSYRTYRLDRFHVAGRIATAGEAGGLKKASRTRQRLGKFFPTFATPEDRLVVQEASLRFDPGILCLRGNVKLNGYWQCERYFADRRHYSRRLHIARGAHRPRPRRSGPDPKRPIGLHSCPARRLCYAPGF